ncbi:MAG: hypothetical protein HUU01_19455 [Saprospiraceae bacterium]|nr:hypothetical protein [Saprospiraceae bacterium]
MISAIFTLAVLVVMPKINIDLDNSILKLNSEIGGYNISLFNGKLVLDLTSFKEGLDLKGGIRILLKADVEGIESSERDNALESAKEIISNRINFLGVSEPNISTSKINEEYRIIVEIPGIDNVADAVSLIGKTAQLKFKQLDPTLPWSEDKFMEYFQTPIVWQDTGIIGSDLNGVDVVID